MKIIDELSDDNLIRYRRACLGENFGWIIFKSDICFVPVQRVYAHPEDGPVVLIGNAVIEIDPDDYEVFRTEDAARDAYWAKEK